MRVFLLVTVFVCVWGCAPLRANGGIADARERIAQARSVRAAQRAPYEFALAEAYLDKAREEDAEGEHEDAIALASRSLQMADRALALAIDEDTP